MAATPPGAQRARRPHMSQGPQQPGPESLAPSSGPRASPQAHLLPHSPATTDVRTSRGPGNHAPGRATGRGWDSEALSSPKRKAKQRATRECVRVHTSAVRGTHHTCTCASPANPPVYTRVDLHARTCAQRHPQAPIHPHHTYPRAPGVIRTLHKHMCTHAHPVIVHPTDEQIHIFNTPAS